MTTNNHPAHGPVSLDRLHQISEILSKAAAQSDGGNLGYAMADAVKVIDEVLNAEPVLYAAEETLAYAKMGELHLKCLSQPMGDAVIPLYTATPAQVVQPVMFIDGDISASDAEKLAAVIREWDDAPAPERDRVRREHAEWSQATFGDVGPVGPLKHLSKEALEAAAEPGDLSEWADMQFLLWDAQRRAGISDEQITLAMVEKLAVNKQREWPEPKDGEPRLHIKEQPAPVVPEYPETLPCPVLLEPGMRFGKGVKTRLVLEAIQRRAEHYAELEAMTPEQRAEHDAGIEAIKAMLPKPAQPDIEMLASALTNAPLAPSDRQGRPRAPVVPEECKEAPAYVKALTKEGAYIYGFNACRAAMLQGKSELPAYEIKRFGDFSARSFGLEIGELTTSIQLFHFDRGTTPEPKHRGSFVYKYALQAIINTLQQQCDELSDTPVTVIWPAAPQQEVKS